MFICAFLTPFVFISIVFLGIYFKRHTGYLTKDIYLTIGSDSIISMRALSCNMPSLPVISTESKIAILKNNVILGYNPPLYKTEYNYHHGYFIISVKDKEVTSYMKKEEYESILDNMEIQEVIQYRHGYQYINIPAYKTNPPVVKDCEPRTPQ